MAVICYQRPVPDDFDRYIYEAIVLGRSLPLDAVYNVVKHESPRAEASSSLDSPQHLREIEPLYAIRLLYLKLIEALSGVLPVQHAINCISALSFLGIGIVVLLWTKAPLQSALLMAYYPVLLLARMGTPDALAALLSLSALWLIDQKKEWFGFILLFLSLGVRTDSVLLLLAVLAWLAWEKRISFYIAALMALFAVALVLGIDHWAGNYGWVVLFRFSFIAGRYPSQIPHTLSLGEYLSVFARGIGVLLTQLSLWILLGLWAWMRRPSPLLIVASVAVVLHFVLFPSPEVRYHMWAALVAAVALIQSFAERSLRQKA